jgi:hypothetical protein
MSVPASISSGSSDPNRFWLQIQSQQTQRIADQATQTARTLREKASDARAEARDAQTQADRAQEQARSFDIKADQAQATANQTNQNLQSAASIGDMQANVKNFYTSLPETIAFHAQASAPTYEATAAKTTAASNSPAVGSVINTTA